MLICRRRFASGGAKSASNQDAYSFLYSDIFCCQSPSISKLRPVANGKGRACLLPLFHTAFLRLKLVPFMLLCVCLMQTFNLTRMTFFVQSASNSVNVMCCSLHGHNICQHPTPPAPIPCPPVELPGGTSVDGVCVWEVLNETGKRCQVSAAS